ncbi:MAG: hypothetical protein WD205_10215 [Rhodothermales bacterium]
MHNARMAIRSGTADRRPNGAGQMGDGLFDDRRPLTAARLQVGAHGPAGRPARPAAQLDVD